MGDMADLAINGETCSWCGIFFEEDHGYPVLCESCADGKKNEELLKKYGLQNAIIKEV